jgi:hypothetical protein
LTSLLEPRNLTGALAKKSLIVVNQETGRETRYRFHEVDRQNEALTLFQKAGDLRRTAGGMAELGRLEMLNNDLESARKYLDETAALVRKLNIKSIMSGILHNYG